jgi:hypothetical protein
VNRAHLLAVGLMIGAGAALLLDAIGRVTGI